jgi:hypothetical protein
MFGNPGAVRLATGYGLDESRLPFQTGTLINSYGSEGSWRGVEQSAKQQQ